MRAQDVRLGVLEEAVSRQPAEFHTRDISEDPDVVAAHRRFSTDRNYDSMIGRTLSEARGRFGISEVAKNRSRGSLWRKRMGQGPAVGRATQAASMPAAKPIRDGHWRAVRAMADPEFHRIVQLFDSREEIGGTYFRIGDKGFQPVDLHPTSVKPLTGIGSVFAAGVTADQLAEALDDRVQALIAKREKAASSPEKQIEARFVRNALTSALRLEPLPSSLRFIASQWRIDLGGTGRPLDLLAADTETGALVVVELKPKSDTAAVAQVAEYVAAMRGWAVEVTEFFAALAHTMAEVYGCPDMPAALLPGRIDGIAAWPRGDGSFEVVQCR